MENKELKLQLEHAADDYNGLLFKLLKFHCALLVLNSKCTQTQKELEDRKLSENKLSEENTKLLARLQDADERIFELESKIASDHAHFQQILDEHTQKFVSDSFM